jgi:hypothetical protein
MNFMKQFFYALGLSAVLLLSACSASEETFTYEIKGKEFSIDQPTPGANSAQIEVNFDDIKAAAEAKGLDAAKISKATLEKVELVAKEGQNLNGFESVLLQMTTPKADLSEVAILNPIAAGTTNASLTMAKNAEMSKYFTGEKLTLVLDMNATDGDTLKHDLILNATFQLSAPKK